MLPLFSLAQASELDHRLIRDFGLSEENLIDSAASGALAASKEHIVGKTVLFLVGKGNNGSDALEMARLALPLASKVSVLLYSEKGNGENLRRRALLPEACFVDSFVDADTIVDGLFGFGFHGELEEKALALLDAVNLSKSFVIALDVPSAFSLKADLTVCFMARKLRLYDPKKRGNSGRVVFVNPGFPEEELTGDHTQYRLLEDKDYSIKPFVSSDYKNSRGHLLVVGGSERFTGAPVLASLSAFHAGVGLVSLLSCPSVLEKAYASYPSIMPLQKNQLDFSRFSAIVAGPGWDEGDKELLDALSKSGKNVVVDADGLKLLSGCHFEGRGVITPHLGEFKRLKALLGIPEGSTEEEVAQIAQTLGVVVVLKGSSVFIGDGESLYVYDGCNPSLGVAGSGDVLAGIIGAFLASGENPLSSAINGVILHQMAGKALSEKLGYYPAEEIVGEIGRLR